MATLNLLASAARPSAGRSSPVDVSTTPTIKQTLAITAIGAGQAIRPSGEVAQQPTLEVTIETSPTGVDDEGDHWYTLWTKSVHGLATIRVPPLNADNFVRARWIARSATTASPSITWSLTGSAD